MSSSDSIKEKNEYGTFLKACNYCESHSVNIRTQSIMRFLNGSCIIRAKNDRPDIITTSSKGGKEYIIGIEMFIPILFCIAGVFPENSSNRK